MTLSPTEQAIPPRPTPKVSPTSLPRGLRSLGLLLLVCGLIGLVAASALLVEKISVLDDPEHIPSCNVSPVLSCGSVMNTTQAEAFGIPNPIIGIAGFAVLAMTGTVLVAGFTMPRWFRVSLQLGVAFAVIFVHWLIAQSLYSIGALCPYCMVVWAVTIPAFWYTTVALLQSVRHTGPPWVHRAVILVTDYRGTLLTVWFLVIAALVTHRFWDYWSSLL